MRKLTYNNAVVMPCLVVPHLFSGTETRWTQVNLLTALSSAFYADSMGDIRVTRVALIQHAWLCNNSRCNCKIAVSLEAAAQEQPNPPCIEESAGAFL